MNAVLEPQVEEVVRRGVAYPVVVLMLLSLAGLGCTFWLHPFWFISPRTHIDPWVYWGTGQDFRYPGMHFGTTYYFRRWTLTFPNYFFEHLFSPYLAQLVLRSCLLFALCFLGGLLAFLLTGALSAGAVATLGFAYFGFIVRSVGTSYSQGTGLVLWFAVACVIVKWRSAASFYLFGKSLGAAVLLSLLFVTYQWTVYLWFALATLGLPGMVSRYRALSVRDVVGRVIPLVLTGCIVGVAMVVALDLEVGRLIGVPWPNVISYTLDIRKNLEATVLPPSVREFLIEQVFTSKSFAVIGVAVSATLAFSRRRLPGCRVFAGCVLVLSVTYLLDPWTGANSYLSMQTIIYLGAALIIAAALLISSTYELALAGVTSRVTRLGGTAALCASGAICTIALALFSDAKWWVPVSVVAVTAAAGSIISAFTERRIVLVGVLLLAASSNVAALAVTMRAWIVEVDGDFTGKADAAHFIEQLTNEHRSLVARAAQDGRRVWILDNRPQKRWSPSISAAYGLYSAFAVGFPPKVSCSQISWLLNTANSTVVLYGSTRSLADDVAMIANLAKPCDRITLRLRDRPPESAVWFDVSRAQ